MTRESETTSRRPVVKQLWEESERGWGTRPDGYSLHLSESDRVQFIRDYWNRMPQTVPSDYSRPYGGPFIVDVNKKLYREIEKSKNGLRFY
jgi:hypothetical protein